MVIKAQKYMSLNRGFSALVLVYMTLLLVFNRGASHIAIGPIYIGELFLFLSLLLLFFRAPINKYFYFLVLFSYAYFVIHVLAVIENQNSIIVVARNSAWWWYSPLVLLGAFLRSHISSKDFIMWIRLTALIFFLYSLTHPFRGIFESSPDSFLGWYSSSYLTAVVFGFFLIFFEKNRYMITLGFSIIALYLLYFQSRAGILSIALVCILIWRLVRYRNLKKLIVLSIILTPIFVIFLSSWHGDGARVSLSLDNYVMLLKSILFSTGSDSLDGGVADRISWWIGIINNNLASSWSIIFGEGLNQILVDTGTQHGSLVRFPHNGFVTVFAFTGVVGLVLSVTVLFVSYKHATLKIVRSRSELDVLVAGFAALFIISFSVASFFSTALESPFYVSTLWIILGMLWSRKSAQL